MHMKLLYWVSFVLVLGFTGSVTAQDWDIEIPSTNTPPVIDGELDGVWSIASVQYITIPINGTSDSQIFFLDVSEVFFSVLIYGSKTMINDAQHA